MSKCTLSVPFISSFIELWLSWKIILVLTSNSYDSVNLYTQITFELLTSWQHIPLRSNFLYWLFAYLSTNKSFLFQESCMLLYDSSYLWRVHLFTMLLILSCLLQVSELHFSFNVFLSSSGYQTTLFLPRLSLSHLCGKLSTWFCSLFLSWSWFWRDCPQWLVY